MAFILISAAVGVILSYAQDRSAALAAIWSCVVLFAMRNAYFAVSESLLVFGGQPSAWVACYHAIAAHALIEVSVVFYQIEISIYQAVSNIRNAP